VSLPRRHFDSDVNGGRVSQTEALLSESSFFGTFVCLCLVSSNVKSEFYASVLVVYITCE